MCIQKGGFWEAGGIKVGAPLFDLYRYVQSILWPDDDHHIWSDLILKTILENRITAVMGSKDSGKTHTMAKYALVDYFCFPRETLILMSSTDLRGLELRVWGDIKDLFNRAKEVWPEAPGYAMDSKYGIFTDQLSDEGLARDIRRGLICLPVMDSEGKWTGMRRWVGVKQKRRRVLGDECQFYPSAFLPVLANLNKGNFKGVFVGNPIGENDPLDKLSEPQAGWDSLLDYEVATTWENTMGGTTIGLVGTDSPAIRNPGKYPYLIDQDDIDYIERFWGKDSSEWWNQAMGKRMPGVSLKRVVTRDMVKKFGAQGEVVWGIDSTIKGYGIDASYGGDRCVGGAFEFGKDIHGIQVINFSKPVVIPVRLWGKNVPENDRLLPEDQIATYVKSDCERLNIRSAHVYHDATGRGSLGTAFARWWTADTNPIEFGGNPTKRHVQADLFVYDEDTRQRRLKRCDEHYSKFVTELWFSLRYAIEAGQVRGLDTEVVEELCAREWGEVRGYKKELEVKEDTKKRLGRSPDKADWAVICMEGARQLGFEINRLELRDEKRRLDDRWKGDLKYRVDRFKRNFQLDSKA